MAASPQLKNAHVLAGSTTWSSSIGFKKTESRWSKNRRYETIRILPLLLYPLFLINCFGICSTAISMSSLKVTWPKMALAPKDELMSNCKGFICVSAWLVSGNLPPRTQKIMLISMHLLGRSFARKEMVGKFHQPPTNNTCPTLLWYWMNSTQLIPSTKKPTKQPSGHCDVNVHLPFIWKPSDHCYLAVPFL